MADPNDRLWIERVSYMFSTYTQCLASQLFNNHMYNGTFYDTIKCHIYFISCPVRMVTLQELTFS